MHTLPGLRTAYVPQHHAEALATHAHLPAAQFLAEKFGVTELEARTRLGRFGLKGTTAALPIGHLSGGQRVKLSLAAVTWQQPHILFLDEPSNHLDMQMVQGLCQAVRRFAGAVVMVSHNRALCAACCQDLWVVEHGRVRAMRGDEDGAPFAELFAQYAEGVLSRAAGTAVAQNLQRRGQRAADALGSMASAHGDKSSAANRQGAGAGAARAGLF